MHVAIDSVSIPLPSLLRKDHPEQNQNQIQKENDSDVATSSWSKSLCNLETCMARVKEP